GRSPAPTLVKRPHPGRATGRICRRYRPSRPSPQSPTSNAAMGSLFPPCGGGRRSRPRPGFTARDDFSRPPLAQGGRFAYSFILVMPSFPPARFPPVTLSAQTSYVSFVKRCREKPGARARQPGGAPVFYSERRSPRRRRRAEAGVPVVNRPAAECLEARL